MDSGGWIVFRDGRAITLDELLPSERVFLVVEDEQGVRSRVTRHFSSHAPTIGVSSVADARKVIAGGPRLWGLVIDWGLPDGYSNAVIEEARVQTAAPILLVTGYTEPEIEQMAWQYGVPFVEKPVPRWKWDLFAEQAMRRDELQLERRKAHANRCAASWSCTARETLVLLAAIKQAGDPTLTYFEITARSPSAYCRGTFNNQVSSLLKKARKQTGCQSLSALVTWVICAADR